MTGHILDPQLAADLAAEIARQDHIHPAGFPFTRDGVRLGIASLEDEVGEVYDEWRGSKRHLGNARDQIRTEIMQVMGIAARMIRELDAST